MGTRAPLRKLVDSLLVVAVVLVGVGLIAYSRNGAEYFAGDSGGAYWSDMDYCKTHPNGQMKIYAQLVSCQQILAQQNYCSNHMDGSVKLGSDTIVCDLFLGVQDEHSPYDVY